MGNWGAKVSKEGYDVKTAADKDLVLKSNINIFKVSDEDSGEIAASGSKTIAHGLSIIPHFLAFMEDAYGRMRLVTAMPNLVSNRFQGYANTTNVVLENIDDENAKDYYVYIFYDPQPT